MKKIIGLLMASLMLTISMPSMANMKGDGQCPTLCMKRLSKELNLTKEQASKIKAIKEQAHKTMKGDYDKLKMIKSQLKTLVHSETLDESKLDALLAQKKELLASKMKTKIMMKHQIYNILTPDQKEKFSAMEQKWEKKWHDKKMKDYDDEDED